MKVLIIGGVASGMSAATRIRRLIEDAEITVYEMAEHVSYANCGLPYFVSNVISKRDDLLLQTPESLWARFRITVKVNHQVVSINRERKTISITNLVTSETSEDSYDKLIIATGAKPRKPHIPGIQRALSLRNVTDADHLKLAIEKSEIKSAAILGGGFIGIELAENLKHLGLDVTIIQRGPQLLTQTDPEIVEPFAKNLLANGIRIELEAAVNLITETEVILNDGRAISAGLVLAAAGVLPDNELALKAGLKIGSTGGLWVDSRQTTSDPDIFAAGDAVEKNAELTGENNLVPLANLANRHGRLIADVIAGRNVHAHSALGTAIIGAFGMTLATTGLTEKQAIKHNVAHTVIHTHSNSHAGYYPGSTRISLKVLFDPQTGKLLGAQGVGRDGIDKRIDVLATAIRCGMTVDELMDLELSYAPQFGSAKDAVNMVGYVGNNVWSGTTPTLQWHELAAAMKHGDTVIDVRSRAEHDAGHIPGSLNIPVDEIRERLSEFPEQGVVVYCAVGQRGHIATQILKAHHIEVKNLDGGYSTWKELNAI